MQTITHPTIDMLERVDRYFYNNGCTVYCVYDEDTNQVYWAVRTSDSTQGITFDNFTQLYDYYMYCMKHGFKLYTISEIVK